MSSDLNDKLNLISNARNDIKSSLINKGQLVNNDIRTYANAIYNISSGSGDVKLFDTIANMQNSSGNHDSDLAVVYASSQANITEDTEFQIAIFPETVTLTTAVTDYIEIGFKPVESAGVMFDCWGSLSPEGFNIDVYTDEGNIRVQYTSQDGLTYTRTEFTQNETTIEGNELDFGVVIKFGSDWMSLTWDDRIGQFIVTGSFNFKGLFNYVTNIPNYASIYGINISEIDVETKNITYTYTANTLNLVQVVDIMTNNLTVLNNTITPSSNSIFLEGGMDLINNNGILEAYFKSSGASYSGLGYTGFPLIYVLYVNAVPFNIYKLSIDLNSNSATYDIYANYDSLDTIQSFGAPYAKSFNYNFLNKEIYTFAYNKSSDTFSIPSYANVPRVFLIGENLNNFEQVFNGINYICNTYNEWNYTPTQFAISNSESIYKGTFYGKNGDVVGTLSQNTGLTSGDELRTRAEIYDSFSELSTDSNVAIDLSYTFSNLKCLPPIINIPNIGNMYSTFAYFEGNTIDVSNFDTSNCSNFVQCFFGCNNLVEFSEFDLSNSYNIAMLGMFSGCNNLSDNSINNIINSILTINSQNLNVLSRNLSNANYYSPFVGTNISNTRYQNRWSELTAAGWTY